jgi:CheY-like chemotaxis protein
MIVDDDPDVVYIYKKVLERAGHRVIDAHNGRECLKKLRQDRPCLIFLDIMMPGMDGWEVCRRIKEDQKTKDIAVIMVSVLDDKEDIKKSLEYAHADAHISKFSVDLGKLLLDYINRNCPQERRTQIKNVFLY